LITIRMKCTEGPFITHSKNTIRKWFFTHLLYESKQSKQNDKKHLRYSENSACAIHDPLHWYIHPWDTLYIESISCHISLDSPFHNTVGFYTLKTGHLQRVCCRLYSKNDPGDSVYPTH
jgi:hypothetical protein